MNSCYSLVLLSAASVTLGCFSELKGNMQRHHFLSKEVCNDKSCQMVGLSGQSVVLAFSVINFSSSKHVSVTTDQIALKVQQLGG